MSKWRCLEFCQELCNEHPALFLHRTWRAVFNQDQKLAAPRLFMYRLNGPLNWIIHLQGRGRRVIRKKYIFICDCALCIILCLHIPTHPPVLTMVIFRNLSLVISKLWGWGCGWTHAALPSPHQPPAGNAVFHSNWLMHGQITCS